MSIPTWHELIEMGMTRPRLGTGTMVLSWNDIDPEYKYWEWAQEDGRHRGAFSTGELKGTADALCGFEAVKFLSSLGNYKEFRISKHGDSWCAEIYHLMAGGEPDRCERSLVGATMDEALRSLVAAVLGEQGK